MKALWGLLQGACLAATVVHLRGRGVADGVLAAVLLPFGGVLVAHAYAGQVTLPLLAIWISCRTVFTEDAGGRRLVLAAWAASAKVLTVFPLLGRRWRARDLAVVGATLAACVVLSAPVALLAYGGDVASLLRDWVDSMFSGTQTVDSVRMGFKTREIQGLAGFVLRAFELDEENRPLLAAVLLGCFATTAAAWWRASRGLSREASHLGWLALTPTVQALSWFHFFWLAFPLCARCADLAWTRRDRAALAGTALGTLMISAMTEKTLGTLGSRLEMASVKSWGVLLVLVLWWRLNRGGDPSRGSSLVRPGTSA